MYCGDVQRIIVGRDGAFYTYIMASASGVLYVGVTNNLVVRVAEHKEGSIAGFTQRYRVNRPVWYEPHSSIRAAIAREKEIKGWKRMRKVHLIEERNPRWHDFSLGPATTVEPRTPENRHSERSLRSEESLLDRSKRDSWLRSE
jgi:putative endonuclease